MASTHSQHDSPYHDCGRCGCTRHLKELTWQRGVLVCKTGGCYDTELIGHRESAIESALSAIVNQPDAMPDDKLLNPSIGTNNEDDIIFS